MHLIEICPAGKKLSLVIIFLLLLVSVTSAISEAEKVNSGFISFGSGKDWNSGSGRGFSVNKDILEPISGIPSEKEAEFISPWLGERSAISSFDRLVFSWNATTPPGTAIELKAQLSLNGKRTSWVSLGAWKSKGKSFSKSTSTKNLTVSVDTIKIKVGRARNFRFKILMEKEPSGQVPKVRNISATYWNSGRSINSGPLPLTDRTIDIPVPRESQYEEDPEIAPLICSPTAVSMVLGHYGLDLGPTEVAKKVYDSGAGIYGNWSFNTAFAGSLGFFSYVKRFRSIRGLLKQIKEGRPVVASIAYEKGELPNAPEESTPGHLIVVRGFKTEGGKEYVIVNDPAAPDDSSVRREYELENFTSAWRGIGYVIYPEEDT